MRAKRHNNGKLRLELVPPEGYEGAAKVFLYGAEKYDDFDWCKGDKYMTTIASLLRHTMEFRKGNDYDKESGLLHTDLITANAMMLTTYQERGIGEDNRPIVNKGEENGD
jgi:hypothetical protein